jgi:hypothetical protein
VSYTINGIAYPSVTSVLGIKDKGEAIIQWAVNCAVDTMQEALKIDTEKAFIWSDIKEESKTAWKTTRDNTADIGTAFHDLVESFIKMKMNHYTESFIEQEEMEAKYIKNIQKYQPYNLKQMFLQFYLWQDKNVRRYHRSEQTIVHEGYCYAGTEDIVYEDYDGNVWLIDLKTKNALYGGEAEQVAAYMLAMNNMQTGAYKVKSRYGEYVVNHKEIKINKCGVLMIARDYLDLKFVDYSAKYKSRLNAFLKLLDFYYADKKRRLKNNKRVKECI